MIKVDSHTIRIERNTHNLFSLLQFIAFVINAFTFSHLTDAFIQSDLQGNVRIHLVRRIELATLRLLNYSSKQLLYPLYHYHTCRFIYIHIYRPIHSLLSCSRRGGGVGFCHDYGLVFFISVHDHLLLASGEKKRLFL